MLLRVNIYCECICICKALHILKTIHKAVTLSCFIDKETNPYSVTCTRLQASVCSITILFHLRWKKKFSIKLLYVVKEGRDLPH